MDVHKGEGGPAPVDSCGQGEEGQNLIFCGRYKWMAPIEQSEARKTLNPRSTSDELSGMVAKRCFAMFSCFEL